MTKALHDYMLSKGKERVTLFQTKRKAGPVAKKTKNLVTLNVGIMKTDGKGDLKKSYRYPTANELAVMAQSIVAGFPSLADIKFEKQICKYIAKLVIMF